MIIKGGVITSFFDDHRPLNATNKTHVHGAIDIARGDGNVISPCDGIACAYVMARCPGEDWASPDKTEIESLPFIRYWYDIFGGLITITEPSGKMHILTHFYTNQLQSNFGPFAVLESAKETRFPCTMLASRSKYVERGQFLSRVGNAGYSTAPHVHWEIHNQMTKLDDYKDRVDPEAYIESN